ncbi:MAG: amino acid permease [Salinibacter sp.]
MTKHLERDLGLYTTITVSIGAMIGSGLFVLPGLAAGKAGPSVMLAYALAGLIVLPAALSKAEMGTAMPESGGTYLYIDRAMGPLMGTISGLGAWFSLVFKSAFALVGLGAYLVVVLPLPAAELKLVSLGLGVLLIAVNIGGVKQSGALQAFLVSFVLLILFTFGAEGVTYVQAEHYHPFFEKGIGGLLSATGFVFVSYAGVTKIASIAEEVERPDRNLPLGMLLSIAVMIPIYTVVVFVIVGVTPAEILHTSLTPMADATEQLLGVPAKIGISVVAVLALLSMANAGILSSSRFPLAMSRDRLAPESLSAVSDRFQTPIQSILATGGLLLVLIAFVPVVELAKLASAFQILVFSFENAAVITFREGGVEEYDPAFQSPAYPWIQIGGILGGLVLLTQMGWIPLIGAAAFVVIGLLWYRLYGRERTEREGVALEALRRRMQVSLFARMRTAFSMETGDVMVAVSEEAAPEEEERTLSMGADIARRWESRVLAARFETVPEQMSLSEATVHMTDTEHDFEDQIRSLEAFRDTPVEAHDIVCHDPGRAALHFIRTHDVRLMLGTITPSRWGQEMIGTNTNWIVRKAPCEVAFFAPHASTDEGLDSLGEIVILLPRAPYGPMKAFIADALAQSHGARIQFLTAMAADVTDAEVDTVQAFHDRLGEHCESPTSSRIIRTDDEIGGLVEAVGGADLAIVGTLVRSRFRSLFFSDRTTELLEALPCDVLMVRPQQPRQNTPLRRLVERYVF